MKMKKGIYVHKTLIHITDLNNLKQSQLDTDDYPTVIVTHGNIQDNISFAPMKNKQSELLWNINEKLLKYKRTRRAINSPTLEITEIKQQNNDVMKSTIFKYDFVGFMDGMINFENNLLDFYKFFDKFINLEPHTLINLVEAMDEV